MGECWVYKAYRCQRPDDRLLYVGISDTPGDRMTQHARDKWWWHLVNRLEWFKVESRERAALLESNLIAKDRPLFNKHQSTLTAGEVLFGCLDLVRYSFEHCPLCLSACRHSVVEWQAKFLCTVDVNEEHDAYCFEVRMSCSAFHPHVEWTQLVPIDVLCSCSLQMPEEVLAGLWAQACDNGEVGDDIEQLRPPTLAALMSANAEPAAQLAIEATK